MKTLGLITEGFGHGFFCLLYAKAMGLTPVAFSEKDNEADFTAQVEQIYNNLAFFAPNMVKATWEEREQLLAEGLNIRCSGQISMCPGGTSPTLEFGI